MAVHKQEVFGPCSGWTLAEHYRNKNYMQSGKDPSQKQQWLTEKLKVPSEAVHLCKQITCSPPSQEANILLKFDFQAPVLYSCFFFCSVLFCPHQNKMEKVRKTFSILLSFLSIKGLEIVRLHTFTFVCTRLGFIQEQPWTTSEPIQTLALSLYTVWSVEQI